MKYRLAVLFLLLSLFSNIGQAQAVQPNIVVVVLDDMRASDWQAMSATNLLPGTFFPNYITTTPVCCPSRTSLLTGLYTHNHRVLRNEGPNGGWPQFHQRGLEKDTIAYVLQQSGYRTALFGKYLNNYNGNEVPVGWDQWYVTVKTAYHDYSIRRSGQNDLIYPNGYLTDDLKDKALSFVDKTDDPFFLYLSFKTPHGPSTPANRHVGAFAGSSIVRDDSFNETDVSDKPRYIRETKALSQNKIDELDQRERKRLASLLSADEAISQLWQSLIDQGKADNTYLFIISDNGYLLGHHRWVGKQVPYDMSVRVPMFVMGPGIGTGTNEQLIANIDLAPTFADIAGTLFVADGHSMFEHQRQDVLIEFVGNDAPGYSALRRLDLLYVEYETGERELYDYVSDPLELNNIVDAVSLDYVNSLSTRLKELSTCVNGAC